MFGWLSARRRWLLGASAVGICGYVGYKLWENQHEIALIYREVSKVLGGGKHNKLKAHYEETQLSCDEAVATHLATLRERLLRLQDTDALQADLRRTQDREHKLELWQRLKVASLARTIAAVYALALTHLLMRILANLVARHLMLERSCADGRGAVGPGNGDSGAGGAAAAGPATRLGLPQATQLRLLSAAEHLVYGEGLLHLLAAVDNAVRCALEGLPLTAVLGASDVEALVQRVRATMETGSSAHALLRGCMLAGPADTSLPDPAAGAHVLCHLLGEARAVLASAPFAVVAQQTLDACFQELSADLAERVAQVQPSGAVAEGLPLAKLVPQVNNAFATVLESSLPQVRPLQAAADAAAGAPRVANRYMRAACRAPSLNELCFMVYAPAPGTTGESGGLDCYSAVRAMVQCGAEVQALPGAQTRDMRPLAMNSAIPSSSPTRADTPANVTADVHLGTHSCAWPREPLGLAAGGEGQDSSCGPRV